MNSPKYPVSGNAELSILSIFLWTSSLGIEIRILPSASGSALRYPVMAMRLYRYSSLFLISSYARSGVISASMLPPVTMFVMFSKLYESTLQSRSEIMDVDPLSIQ